jgi:ABC-type lipoprotein export system ATPase subunit
MGEEVLKLLKKINEEKRTTILVVTHDEEVASWAQRVLFIRDGKLIK